MLLSCFEGMYAQRRNANAQRLPSRSGVGVRSVESELQNKLYVEMPTVLIQFLTVSLIAQSSFSVKGLLGRSNISFRGGTQLTNQVIVDST